MLKEDELKKYKEYIIKRLNNIPIQYITNQSYFRKLKLFVDERVLIPRPETELVVEKAKEIIKTMLEQKVIKYLRDRHRQWCYFFKSYY